MGLIVAYFLVLLGLFLPTLLFETLWECRIRRAYFIGGIVGLLTIVWPLLFLGSITLAEKEIYVMFLAPIAFVCFIYIDTISIQDTRQENLSS